MKKAEGTDWKLLFQPPPRRARKAQISSRCNFLVSSAVSEISLFFCDHNLHPLKMTQTELLAPAVSEWLRTWNF